MVAGLSILVACLLAGLLLIVLPLQLSGKEKILVLLTSIFLGLLGVLGKDIFPIWEILLLQTVLAFLFSYLLNKKVTHDEVEMKDDLENDAIPMFDLEELQAKAEKSKTLDVYYTQISHPSESAEVTSENEVESIGQELPFEKEQQETALETEDITESEVPHIDLLEKLENPGADSISLEDDIDINGENEDLESLFKSEAEVAAAMNPADETDDDISKLLENRQETFEEKPSIVREEPVQPSPVFSSEGADDAELLMKARMEMFLQLDDSESLIAKNKTGVNEDEPIDLEEVVLRRPELIDDKTIENNEDIMEEFDEKIVKKRERSEKAFKRLPTQFDDLEELYLKRQQKEES
jgi:uncharacterized membrane protein (DUF106 family)